MWELNRNVSVESEITLERVYSFGVYVLLGHLLGILTFYSAVNFGCYSLQPTFQGLISIPNLTLNLASF
jgi:hypothetical protein